MSIVEIPLMVEYNSKTNRFPFQMREQSVSICTDNHEYLYDLDFIYNKIVERFPSLRAELFYSKISEIEGMKEDENKVRFTKDACDALLREIRVCLEDEQFVHSLHDKWGLGIDKLIGTLYAVYGYYFYTGKRTANVIKKTIDAYKKQPVH